jgi:AcrR family transcriptional regulator
VQAAGELFMRLGIRSVTMDDVARELAMSKKTLYQHFSNKNSLVTAIAEAHIKMEMIDFEKITADAANAIEEIHGIAKCMRRNVAEMNPSTLYDLQKFHQDAWKTFLNFKDKFIAGYVEQNMRKGVKEGFYRKEIDVKILARLRVEQVQIMFDPKIFPPSKFNFAEVQNQMLDHFIHGLLTEKGRDLYHKFQQEEIKSLLK